MGIKRIMTPGGTAVQTPVSRIMSGMERRWTGAQWVRLLGILVGLAILGACGYLSWLDFREGRAMDAMPWLVIFAGCAVMLVLVSRVFLIRLRIAIPDITVSPDPAGVGGDIGVNWRQAFLGSVRITRAVIRLVFWERTVKGSGKNQSVYREETEVGRKERAGQEFLAGDQMALSARFQIPSDSMHTFKTRSNEIGWRLEAVLYVAGWPDCHENRVITVAPRLEG
jgi:hypothetical protein